MMTNAAPLFANGICSAREAIYALAGELLEEPVDPFADSKALGQMASGGSRWLLANRAAARARADHGGEGTPRPTQEWIALRERERFSAGAPASLFSDDRVFAMRIEAVDHYAAEIGVNAAALAAQFDRLAPEAEAYLDRRDRRSANIRKAGERVLSAARRAQGPQMYGRDRRTGGREAIDRGLLFHPYAHWRRDSAALIYNNAVNLTGELVIGDIVYTDIVFAADDVLALGVGQASDGAPAPGVDKRLAQKKKSRAAKRAMVKVVIADIFPGSLPLIAKQRDRRIMEEFLHRYGASVGERTIRAAIREMEAEGKG